MQRGREPSWIERMLIVSGLSAVHDPNSEAHIRYIHLYIYNRPSLLMSICLSNGQIAETIFWLIVDLKFQVVLLTGLVKIENYFASFS